MIVQKQLAAGEMGVTQVALQSVRQRQTLANAIFFNQLLAYFTINIRVLKVDLIDNSLYCDSHVYAAGGNRIKL